MEISILEMVELLVFIPVAFLVAAIGIWVADKTFGWLDRSWDRWSYRRWKNQQ